MIDLTNSSDFSERVKFHLDSYIPISRESKIDSLLKNFVTKTFSEKLEIQAQENYFNVFLLSYRSLEKVKNKDGLKIYIKSKNPDFFEQEIDEKSLVNVDLILEQDELETSLLSIINTWFDDIQLKKLDSVVSLSNKNHRILLRSIKNVFKDSFEGSELNDIFSKFLHSYEEFYLSISLESLKASFEKSQKRLLKKNLLQLKTLFEIDHNSNPDIFYIGNYKGSYLFIEVKSYQEDENFIFVLTLFVSYLTRLLNSLSVKSTEAKPAQILFEAFDFLPLPIILLGKENEVLNYNIAFGKLNIPPSKVEKFEDLDVIKNKEDSWTIKKMSFFTTSGESRLTVFYPKSSHNLRQIYSGSQDLGIITSSIAHELNNPIAGILAALEVLMLETYLSEDELKELQEMKQSTLRCKQLVETFLGFSKVNPILSEKRSYLLSECFEQALHLQRFRMIESQLRINLKVEIKHPYSFPLHQPSVTMMAYLVMGEIMTSFHHLRLLENKSSKGQVIELELLEDADNFQVFLKPKLVLGREFSSKLLSYLMEQEKLSLSLLLDGTLVFTHKIMLI